MKLYGSYTSPYVRHCRIALIDAEIDYEFIETDYTASAERSPTKRVPFLQDGDLQLTDSSSIIMHIRNQQDSTFLSDAREMDHYQLAVTAQDTAINLFLMELEGLTPSNNDYLKRQAARLQTSLQALDKIEYSQAAPFNTAELATACLLSWGLYRQRFAIDGLTGLQALLDKVSHWQPFADTAPPA